MASRWHGGAQLQEMARGGKFKIQKIEARCGEAKKTGLLYKRPDGRLLASCFFLATCHKKRSKEGGCREAKSLYIYIMALMIVVVEVRMVTISS